MDDHIGTCEECEAISLRLEHVERELTAAVAILHDSVGSLESAGEQAYELWRQRLPDWETDYHSERIVRLQLFLAPICGFGTAERAMVAAAGRSSADAVELLTESQWPAFVRHLSSIVGALCGEPAGRLLWHIGQSIVPEMS